MNIDQIIEKHALVNAIRFSGKASLGAVIGKIIAEEPDLKAQLGKLKPLMMATVERINKLSADEQQELLKKYGSKALEKKEKEKPGLFDFLKIESSQKVVTAFPPEPSKYPHIGHAKSVILNSMLAKQYKGTFILRFEDTNPELAQKEFYEMHLENYKWLGITPDKIDYASDHMDEIIKFADTLVKEGEAYVCTCDGESMKKNRMKGIDCKCRNSDTELWKQFPTMKEKTAILRMKIDMKHKNSTMRDPALFRIIDHEHPRLGKKYRIWPTYDFENAVMDGIECVTHRLRSKEFEMRSELQRHIQTTLKLPITKTYEFARFNLKGVESSGRIIRELIEKKKLSGWDDPSLTTLVALRRRGFLPEAITSFVVSTGITKSESVLTWDDLIKHNKRLLDTSCERYFFVQDPVKITVTGAPVQEVKLKKHPEDAKRGLRTFKTADVFYITSEDNQSLKDGKMYRLMDCLNFTKKGESFTFHSTDHQEFKKQGEKIIHWLPQENYVTIEVLMPDHSIAKGCAEESVKNVKVGNQIQFERFGFVKLDHTEKGAPFFWFSHQ